MNLKQKYKLVDKGSCLDCCFVNKQSGACDIKNILDTKHELDAQVGNCTDRLDNYYKEIKPKEGK